MNDNFQQSPCQNFTRSGCQNRNNSTSISASFAFICVNAGTTNGWGLETPGKSFGAYTDLFNGFGIQEGQLNSVQLIGGKPASWNINWTVSGNANNGVVTGIYTGLYVSIQGPPNQMYGTMAYHPVVNGSANPPIYGPATVTLMRDWSVRLDSPDDPSFMIRGQPQGVTAFWIGKTPAQLPAANFTFESFGFGHV